MARRKEKYVFGGRRISGVEKGDSLAGRKKIYLLGGKRLSGLDEGELLVGRKTRWGRPILLLINF